MEGYSSFLLGSVIFFFPGWRSNRNTHFPRENFQMCSLGLVSWSSSNKNTTPIVFVYTVLDSD